MTTLCLQDGTSGSRDNQHKGDPKSKSVGAAAAAAAAKAAAAAATKRKREEYEQLSTTYMQRGVSFFRDVLHFMPKRIKRFQGWALGNVQQGQYH